ncbi:hypothetical protein [Halobacillus sp. Marseille-Q1614]|uniref:hypothetical protein n=1 Tax=Halobacillus sp. Marseille-Q1614 TaxID=2709134 RepID=UPI00156EEE5B|nr:hypothetical protein [Halobacillus sp. Marseille-Q1614]
MQFEAKCKKCIMSSIPKFIAEAADEESFRKALNAPHHCFFTEGNTYTFKVTDNQMWESINNFSEKHLFNAAKNFDWIADHFELKTLTKI